MKISGISPQLAIADASNESQFLDVYRFFSISPPPTILGDLHFHLISGLIGSADSAFFAFLSEMRYL
jgi:hypothetical protein